MSNFLAAITTVWTPETIIVATVAGFLLGVLVVGKITSLPSYVSDATALEVAIGLAITGILAGAVFYVGQALVDVAEDIPARLLSRFSVWCIYVLAMAVGTGIRVAVDRQNRRRLLLDRARSEVASSHRGE